MKNKRYLGLVFMFLCAFTLAGITGAKAPVDEGSTVPQSTSVPVSEQQKIGLNAQVYQTMYFTRCGHKVSRRTDVAEAVREDTFDAVRSYYNLWTILEMTGDRVEMERQIDLYCPMHKVVSLDEAGQVVLSENRYGDGMAILKIYEGTAADEKIRNLLIAGRGFDSETEAEKWLSEIGITE